MKLTELISKCEKVLNVHGDLPVTIAISHDFSEDVDVTVDLFPVNTDKDELCVVIQG